MTLIRKEVSPVSRDTLSLVGGDILGPSGPPARQRLEACPQHGFPERLRCNRETAVIDQCEFQKRQVVSQQVFVFQDDLSLCLKPRQLDFGTALEEMIHQMDESACDVRLLEELAQWNWEFWYGRVAALEGEVGRNKGVAEIPDHHEAPGALWQPDLVEILF